MKRGEGVRSLRPYECRYRRRSSCARGAWPSRRIRQSPWCPRGAACRQSCERRVAHRRCTRAHGRTGKNGRHTGRNGEGWTSGTFRQGVCGRRGGVSGGCRPDEVPETNRCVGVRSARFSAPHRPEPCGRFCPVEVARGVVAQVTVVERLITGPAMLPGDDRPGSLFLYFQIRVAAAGPTCNEAGRVVGTIRLALSHRS